MNLHDLNGVDWEEFRKRWPSAHAFLVCASLISEWRALLSNGYKNAWQIERLEELKSLPAIIEYQKQKKAGAK